MEDFGIGSPHRTTYEDKALLRKHGHDYPGMLSNLSKAKSLPWIFEAYEVFFRNVGELMSGNQSSSETVDKVHEAWSSIKVPAATGAITIGSISIVLIQRIVQVEPIVK